MTNKPLARETPSKAGVIGAFVFWGVAGVLSLLTIAVTQLAGWEWGLRLLMVIVGASVVYVSLRRASDRRHRGLDDDRTPTIFDPWTIVHTTAGLVMGAWGIPFPLVALFTVGWEVYEYLVPGFGDTELAANRATDVIVAWVGWLIVAAIVAAVSHTPIPWLPPQQSIVRDAGLHLY
ncbi:MAG: hypothetical protein GC204_11835 [Chloroflexi bacterium]|nr:hypothetical protein [Chloroflexota bacterium]